MWVYKLTNRASGKVYVGKTADLEQRWKDHRRGKGCGAIGRAMRKYGADAFDFVILEQDVADEAELSRLEIEWISRLGSHGSVGGYNLTLGGEGARLTEEMKAMRREAGQWPLGPRHSDEQKALWSIQRKGCATSDKQKLVASLTHKGRPKSEEQRRKMAQAATGRVLSPETRAKISAWRTAYYADRRAA